MTVKDLNGIFAILPPDFEVRVIGLPRINIVLEPLEILDITVSYLHKELCIYPNYISKDQELNTSSI